MLRRLYDFRLPIDDRRRCDSCDHCRCKARLPPSRFRALIVVSPRMTQAQASEILSELSATPTKSMRIRLGGVIDVLEDLNNFVNSLGVKLQSRHARAVRKLGGISQKF